MTFPEALQLIERKNNLLGTTTEKVLLIDLFLVVPTDEQKKKEFVVRLLSTRNPQQSIMPYMNCDVEVWATNSDYLYKQNLMIYDVVTP